MVRRVEPHVRVGAGIEAALAKRRQLLVELGADPAHLALADAAAADGRHQGVDLACAHPEHVRLLNHRQQGAVDASAWFQQRREEGPGAQLGNLQLEPAHTGIQQPAPVAVAVRGSLGVALVRVSANHRAGFKLDEPLQPMLENQLQLIAVSHGEVVEEVLMRHPGVGHSWISLEA